VACTLLKAYFWLDLETCDLADKVPRFHLSIWQDVLQGGMYTRASDICLLGRMLCGLAAMREPLSPLGMDFKQLISQPVEQIGTAAQLLEHPWIACKGTDCRVAGAQPNEHYVA